MSDQPHEHEWAVHGPDRFHCTVCGVLGYRSGMGFGRGKRSRKTQTYVCHEKSCRQPAKIRLWRGTVEEFWCEEHAGCPKK